MKFISIDSSLANTGIAVGQIIDDLIFVERLILHTTEITKNKKVIRASSDTITRCRSTYGAINAIILMERPNVIFVETPSGSQSAAGMKSYGATCQLIGCIQPNPIEVTPLEAKLASVGNKTASKRDIITWAYTNYPKAQYWFWHGGKLQDKNEHLADAIAIAHAGIKTAEFNQLQQIYKTWKPS